MIFKGKFNNEQTEVIKFTFELENIKKNVTLVLQERPNEHFLVTLKDPSGKIRILTTLKTKENYFYTGKNIETISNNAYFGELSSGIWVLEIVREYPSESDYILEIIKDLDLEKINTIDKKGNFIDSFEIDYTKIISEEKKWYKGELHAHTKYSDGMLELNEVPEILKKLNLDFFFITDHNVVSTKVPKGKELILPGTELTLIENGHFNLLGLKILPDYNKLLNGKEINSDSLKKIFDWAKENGALVSMNHPLNQTMGVDYNIDLDCFDTIEVINSPYNKSKVGFNEKALKVFDKLLLNGHKIFAVGGSDSHNKFILNEKGATFGKPINYVLLEKFSVENLLNGLKKGRNYISEIGEIELEIKTSEREIELGEEIDEKNIVYEIKGPEILKWRFIINGKIITEVLGKTIKEKIKLPMDSYLRVEGLKKGKAVVVINPIFRGKINKTNKTWLEMRG